MNKKRSIGILLIAGLLLFGLLGGCGPSEPPSGGPEFELTRQAAYNYFSSDNEFNITAEELAGMIREAMSGIVSFDPLEYYDYMEWNGPIIIDLRGPGDEMPNRYTEGHIPGAIPIPWREITEWRYLSKLSKLRPIVVYSETGQIGAQVAAILNLLGYNAFNLEWGMTSWTSDEDVAPGRYNRARDTVWSWSGSYRAICPISEPIGKHYLPFVDNTDSEDGFTIIKAAADAYLQSYKRANYSSPELNELLYPETPVYSMTMGRPTARWGAEDVPYFLDVREDDTYFKGHLCGCQHIFYKDLFTEENLKRLPADKQILVYSETGHMSGHVTAALNLLGYDAINLKWGITSWSLALPGRDFAPGRYDEDLDCMDYEVIEGFRASKPCPG